ncbi:MAG: MBL fold metallo-hydrolase [Alistipes sp.]
MKIACLPFNPIQENTYVVWDETLECAVIDAGNSNEHENTALRNFITNHHLRPVVALNTHGHFDHTLGVEWLKKTYDIPFALAAKDQFLVDNAAVSGEIYGIKIGAMPTTEINLDTLKEVHFGNTTLTVIPTPGHTPGHVSFYNADAKALFTGDTLFRESIGRTDLPGGDYSWIMRSILDNLLPLGDEVRIYPGHGPESTIGHESLNNPFIVEVLNNEVNYK